MVEPVFHWLTFAIDWRPDTVDGVHSMLTYVADKGPGQVPGVVITGVVVGVLLMLAAIRGMFGKRK